MKKILTEQQPNNFSVGKYIYYNLGKILGFVVSCFFSVIPHRDRVRVIIENSDGKILLIKGLVGRQQWSLPGGGLKRNESYQQAAAREALEETGIKIISIKHLGSAISQESYRPFSVQVFYGSTSSKEIRGDLEIISIRWAEKKEIPREYKNLLHKINDDIK